jgi:hypothetical protein
MKKSTTTIVPRISSHRAQVGIVTPLQENDDRQNIDGHEDDGT